MVSPGRGQMDMLGKELPEKWRMFPNHFHYPMMSRNGAGSLHVFFSGMKPQNSNVR